MTNTLHLHQKLCLDSSGGFVLSIRPISTHGVDLVNEDDGWLFFTGKVEERFDQSFTLTDILTHEVWGWDREEGALSFGCTGFSEIGLSCSWRAVEENSFPGFSASCEDLFESDGQNDSLLESVLGILETCDILPLDVGLFADDGIVELALEVVVLLVAFASSMASPSSTGCLGHWVAKKIPSYFPSSLFLSLPLSSLSLFSY